MKHKLVELCLNPYSTGYMFWRTSYSMGSLTSRLNPYSTGYMFWRKMKMKKVKFES